MQKRSSATHAMCLACWEKRSPKHAPNRANITEQIEELCCYCGMPTRDKIYVRDEDMHHVLCGGIHEPKIIIDAQRD